MKMSDNACKEIKKKLDTIIATQILHGEGLVRIDEHLKTLNGTVKRHDGCIDKLENDNNMQWSELNKHMQTSAEFRGMVNAKLAIAGIGSAGVVSAIAWALGAI